MDEAWLFMRNEVIRDYIVQAEKTWRKHRAAMILATQSVKELEESGLLNIVVESCPTKIFLANPEMGRDHYAEIFHLNPMVCDLIASLYPPGQMVICQPNLTKKAHLNADSVFHWMAVNDPEANLKRREFFDRYGITDGLRELANQFPFEPSRLNKGRSPIPQGAAAA